jgi:hypothetical protein
VRFVLSGALIASAALMITTSSEVGGFFAGGEGHIIAQFYGMFFWSAVVLYVATAWRVVAEGPPVTENDATHPAGPPSSVPTPHVVTHSGDRSTVGH